MKDYKKLPTIPPKTGNGKYFDYYNQTIIYIRNNYSHSENSAAYVVLKGQRSYWVCSHFICNFGVKLF